MKKTEILPVAFILSLFTVLFWAKILFTGNTIFFRDTFLQFFPWQEFAKNSFAAGEVPLWNPYSLCGVPFLANLQTAVFYPLKVFFYFMPFAEALKLFIISNTLLGGLFMFFFVKSFKHSDEAAALAAIVFMFNGYLVNRVEFLSVFAASVWLPLVALAFKRFNETFKAGWLIVLSAALSMPVFAGGAYIWLYNILFLVCFLVFYLVTEKKNKRKRVACLCLAVLGSLLFSAAQLFPFLEYLFNSSRISGGGLTSAFVASLPPSHLLELFIPDLFGNPLKTVYPVSGGETYYWALGFYCGLIPAALAVFYGVRKRSPVTVFLAVLAGITVFFALGAYNPACVFIKKYFPLLNILRYPAAILYLAVFSLSALSAFGFENVFKQADKAKKGTTENVSLVFLGLAALFVLTLMYFQFTLAIPDLLRLSLVKKSLFIGIGVSIGFMVFYILYWGRSVSRDAAALTIIALVFLDLFVYGLNVNPTAGDRAFSVNSETAKISKTIGGDNYRILIDPHAQGGFNGLFLSDTAAENSVDRTRSIIEAKKILFPNYNMAEKIASVNAYDPMLPAEQEKLFNVMMNTLGKNRLIDLYGAKYVLSYVPITGAPELTLVDESKGVNIYLNKSCLPRTFILEGRPPEEYIPLSGFNGKAGIKDYKNREVLVATETVNGGWLVLLDTFYPGWKAFEDGKPVKIERAFKAFRAVQVSSGKHEVRFIYEPLVFKLGVVVTVISALLFALAGVFFWKRKI